jgi:hypothetical protein
MKKRVFRLTESQIDRLSKRFLNESYGLITYQDTICEIVCKEKVAKYGSKGDVVRMIQHILNVNQFNSKYAGGGMNGDFCYKDYKECDGLFKNQTKIAVEQFQKTVPSLRVDGVVGYETWKAMCSELTFTDSVRKDKFCADCTCDDNYQDDFQDIDTYNPGKEIDDIDCEKLKGCVKKYIYGSPVPDFTGFFKCIEGNAKKREPRQGDCGDCPKTINCQPGPNRDLTMCQSDFIKKCFANGCTSRYE